MPSDVAMERPDAWIVLVDLKHDVSRGVRVFGGLHPDGVAALGVAGVGDGVGVFAEALGEDVPVGRGVSCELWRERLKGIGEKKGDLHVMAVHMHGVSTKGKVVVYNQTNSLVRPKVHDVILLGKIEISQLRFQ